MLALLPRPQLIYSLSFWDETLGKIAADGLKQSSFFKFLLTVLFASNIQKDVCSEEERAAQRLWETREKAEGDEGFWEIH